MPLSYFRQEAATKAGAEFTQPCNDIEAGASRPFFEIWIEPRPRCPTLSASSPRELALGFSRNLSIVADAGGLPSKLGPASAGLFSFGRPCTLRLLPTTARQRRGLQSRIRHEWPRHVTHSAMRYAGPKNDVGLEQFGRRQSRQQSVASSNFRVERPSSNQGLCDPPRLKRFDRRVRFSAIRYGMVFCESASLSSRERGMKHPARSRAACVGRPAPPANASVMQLMFLPLLCQDLIIA
jgi:hypothetical protein